MKIQHLIPILFLVGSCTVSAQTTNTVIEPTSFNWAIATEFYVAIQKGDLGKVKAMLKDNPGLINIRNGQEIGPPLRWAAFYGQKEVAEFLLANKADVNGKDMVGCSALMAAASTGQKEVVELLLANNATIDARDNLGQTALHFASSAGVAKVLLANKAEVNAKDKSGDSPLHDSAMFGRKDVAEVLLANKADVNSTNNVGDTPLHEIARGGYEFMVKANGYVDTAEFLLANKAEVNTKNINGETPLHLAINANKDVADLLRQHGGKE
jgi:cytohesin